MKESELGYYEEIGNWDFRTIRYSMVQDKDWDFYSKIRENSNEESFCLDLGTGGGEKILEKYPKVGMVIGSDFSREIIKTARKNQKKYHNKNVRFIVMDNLKINFQDGMFDLISARHTVISASEIFRCLSKDGVAIIEGVDKNDCLELKEMFGRGQGYDRESNIADEDYENLIRAGFTKIKRERITQYEYYESKEELMKLLWKAPIIEGLVRRNDNGELIITNEKDREIFEKYVNKYKCKKGILLKRVIYGIIAKK